MVSWLNFPEQFATPSPSILAQFASARVPFQAPTIFTRQFKPKHWTKRFPSSSPRSHSANAPNRCRDAPSLLGSWVSGHWRNYYGQKNAASTFYVFSINAANFDDTIYRNSQPRSSCLQVMRARVRARLYFTFSYINYQVASGQKSQRKTSRLM